MGYSFASVKEYYFADTVRPRRSTPSRRTTRVHEGLPRHCVREEALLRGVLLRVREGVPRHRVREGALRHCVQEVLLLRGRKGVLLAASSICVGRDAQHPPERNVAM